MRQQIDCAVLRLAAHRNWLEEVLICAEPALARIRLHHLEWEAGQDLETNIEDPVALPVQALAQASVSLRRFDLCLVPVSLDTLSWTRQALALIPRGPFLPLVGVFQHLRSPAMQDLLELGMTDFVRLPLCPDEFRARVLATVLRAPKPGTLREPESDSQSVTRCTTVQNFAFGSTGQTEFAQVGLSRQTSAIDWTVQPLIRTRPVVNRSKRTTQRQSSHPYEVSEMASQRSGVMDSFREAKSTLVQKFERDYITQALVKHNGNIAMAARASNKHRRAFWALMRKYEIDAEQYRPDEWQE